MAVKDKRIDVFIAKSQEFARPILQHLRELVHQACPEVHETIKWGMPHFEYRDKILCGMAAFKEHCSFGFRLGSVMKDPKGVMQQTDKTGMGQFGQIKSMKDLSSDKTLVQYIQEAMRLTEQGVSKPKPKDTVRKELKVPDYFREALKKNKQAFENFGTLSYSHRKEYLDWIIGAKTEPTRNRRVATAVEWLQEGKGLNWKYEKKKT